MLVRTLRDEGDLGALATRHGQAALDRAVQALIERRTLVFTDAIPAQRETRGLAPPVAGARACAVVLGELDDLEFGRGVTAGTAGGAPTLDQAGQGLQL